MHSSIVHRIVLFIFLIFYSHKTNTLLEVDNKYPKAAIYWYSSSKERNKNQPTGKFEGARIISENEMQISNSV